MRVTSILVTPATVARWANGDPHVVYIVEAATPDVAAEELSSLVVPEPGPGSEATVADQLDLLGQVRDHL